MKKYGKEKNTIPLLPHLAFVAFSEEKLHWENSDCLESDVLSNLFSFLQTVTFSSYICQIQALDFDHSSCDKCFRP